MNQLKSGNKAASKKFIFFILISVVFWFMTKLSKEYDDTIEYPVEYVNLPIDKLLQEDPVKKIDIHIKASGFKLLSASLFPHTIKIDASNLNAKSRTNYYLLLRQQRLSVQRQMNAEVQIDHFVTDSINFNLGLLEKKKVPVKVSANLTYDIGYEMDGELLIKPDSIIISGPESILENIHEIKTQELVKENIHESINQELLLEKFPANTNVAIATEKVTVSGKVEKFTEGTIEIPFKVNNLPEGTTVSTYPRTIKVTYRVALSNFQKINATSFVVECDYQMSLDNNLTYLVPKLSEKSDFIKNTTISPIKIDFIIEK